MSNVAGWVLSAVLGVALLLNAAKAPQIAPAVVDAKVPAEEVLPGAYVFGGGRFVVKWIGFGDAHTEIIVGMKGSAEPPVQIMAGKTGLRVTNGTKLGTPIGAQP